MWNFPLERRVRHLKKICEIFCPFRSVFIHAFHFIEAYLLKKENWIYTCALQPRLWFATQNKQSPFRNSGHQECCLSSLSIPFLNFFFQYQFHNISAYPTYHSIHDTFYYVKKFVDPQFTTHLAIARIWVSTAFLLAETPVLPINCSDYGVALNKGFHDINTKYGTSLKQKGISLSKYVHCDFCRGFYLERELRNG